MIGDTELTYRPRVKSVIPRCTRCGHEQQFHFENLRATTFSKKEGLQAATDEELKDYIRGLGGEPDIPRRSYLVALSNCAKFTKRTRR